MMKNEIDISMFVDVLSIEQAMCNLVNRFIKRRKEMKITQKDLARKTGVSYASIRRFETTGEISFKSLLRLAGSIGYLEDFELVFKIRHLTNLEDL